MSKSDDMISRQAAIEAHYEYCNKHPDAGFPVWSLKILEDLPSAQPEPQWIPCSERLPENGHYYLWCSDMGSVQCDYYWKAFENGTKYGYNIIAWMPLPKPYEGREP